MKELKVGEKITLEVAEIDGESCKDCIDCENIIFVEVREQSV
jgi:hypothetical protein